MQICMHMPKVTDAEIGSTYLPQIAPLHKILSSIINFLPVLNIFVISKSVLNTKIIDFAANEQTQSIAKTK